MWRTSLLCVGCFVILVGCQPAPNVIVNSNSNQQQGLVLSGTATVRVKPTLVILRLGATFTHSSPVSAKSQTEDAVKKIIAAVKNLGVNAADVQTRTFNLDRYDPSGTRPGSWRCTSSLEIRVKDVEKAGEVLEAAIAAGANQVSNVQYTVEELQAVRAEARDAASKVIKDKAKQYSSNFGVKLGAPIYIAENSPQGWFYGSNYMTQSLSNSVTDKPSDNDPEEVLSSGSVEVKLTVEVTYALPQ